MDDHRETLATQQRELEELRLEVARREGHIDALEAQLKVRSRWDEDLRQTAENLDGQLLERDNEIAELRRMEQSLREEVEWRREIEKSLREEVEWRRETEESLERRLAAIETTRLWRVGQRYWLLKDTVRRALRRGTQ
jgi:chromosome segregation ATPase